MAAASPWNEGTPGHPLNLKGHVIGRDVSEHAIYEPITVSSFPSGEGGGVIVLTPLAPTLSATQPTRTTSNLSWTPGDSTGRPTVTSWQVQRRSSTDNGVTFGNWADITGSPFAAATLTASQTGLPTGTPELVFSYQVRGVNSDGLGAWSNEYVIQWQAAPVQKPIAPTKFSLTGKTTTTRATSWSMVADSTVDKIGLFKGGTLWVDNLPATATTWNISNLTAGATYAAVGVARHNSAGWGAISNTVDFIQPTATVTFPYGPQMMGSSASDFEHGGTEAWDGWRCYTNGTLLNLANRNSASQPRPKFLAYSKGGANLGGTNPTYQAVFDEAMADLNTFYYTSSTGQTHSTRWGIKLFWSNGNENCHKGCLTPTIGTPASRAANYLISMGALYDACHYIDPTTGQRRFPDAYAGSNPTHNHEQTGEVQYWLEPTAHKHDFVMWSMYDPGRKSTINDPTYNWPGLTEASRTNGSLGNIARCFYRTYYSQQYARANGHPDTKLLISMGEGANGVDPDDPNTRPYWAVHAFAGAMYKWSDYYDLEMPFACWWDSDTDPTAAGSSSDGRSRMGYDDSANRTWSTNWTGSPSPTTREAWQNWRAWNREINGDAAMPAAWKNLPKSTWKTGGTVV